MKYEIVELRAFSGEKATIYSVRIDDEEKSLFEKFIESHSDLYPSAVNEIIERVEEFSRYSGVMEYLLKLNEGRIGDGVSALFDQTEKLLRVYCIRFGSAAIIIGGGSAKPKQIRSWQEDKKLSEEARKMIWLSSEIYKRILSREISLSQDGKYLIGNLSFEKL